MQDSNHISDDESESQTTTTSDKTASKFTKKPIVTRSLVQKKSFLLKEKQDNSQIPDDESQNLLKSKNQTYNIFWQTDQKLIQIQLNLPQLVNVQNCIIIVVSEIKQNQQQQSLSQYQMNADHCQLFLAKKNGQKKEDLPYLDPQQTLQSINSNNYYLQLVNKEKSIQNSYSKIIDGEQRLVNIKDEKLVQKKKFFQWICC